MKPHLQYLWYVVRHKWFVFWAGIQIGGIPIWRLIIHDWSKFLPPEWNPYVEMFYGRPLNEQWMDFIKHGRKVRFDAAWLHHQHHNPHHWQHWVLREDDGNTIVLKMPTHFAREMVADWMGAGRAITGKWDAPNWYLKNEEKIILHRETEQLVNDLLFPLGRGYGHA